MSNNNYQKGVCEVHKYALNDNNLRMVFYCRVCDAWICDDCNNNYPLRAKAALVKKARQYFGNE